MIKKIIFLLIIVLCTSCISMKEPFRKIKDTDNTSLVENTKAPEDKTVIVYARGYDETDSVIKLIEMYNSTNNKIQVQYQELPFDEDMQYKQIKKILYSKDDYIDVIDIKMVWNAEFASKGYIKQLDDYIKRDKVEINKYVKAMISGATYEGKIWAMPRSISTGLFFYRKDIVDKLPETWEDFLLMAKDLRGKENTKYGYVFNGKISDTLVNEAMEFIYSYGGNIFDEEGKLVLYSEETINAMNIFYDIYNSEFSPENIHKITDSDACISFFNGESVFMRNMPWAWAIGNKEDTKIGDQFLVSQLPKGTNGSVSVLSGNLSVINKSSTKQEAAWDFVKFLSGYEGQKIMAVYGGRIPVLMPVMSEEEVIEKNPHFASYAFSEAIQNAKPTLITPSYIWFSDIFQDELYKFLNGRKTAEEFIGDISSKYNGIEE